MKFTNAMHDSQVLCCNDLYTGSFPANVYTEFMEFCLIQFYILRFNKGQRVQSSTPVPGTVLGSCIVKEV